MEVLQHINKAWACLREHDSTIPSDQLDAFREILIAHYSNAKPYPVIELGHGTVNVGEGLYEGKYALLLETKEAGEIGEQTKGNRPADPEAVQAILTFTKTQSIDVVIARLQQLKENMIEQRPVLIYDDEGQVVNTVRPNVLYINPQGRESYCSDERPCVNCNFTEDDPCLDTPNKEEHF